MGKPLCEIETSGAAVSHAPSTVSAPVTQTPEVKPHNNNNNHTRTPLIKFIGKRDHKKHTTVPQNKSESQQQHAPSVVTPTDEFRPSKPQTGVDFYTLKEKAFFGRPKLSQKEMDAIESGGAL